MTKLILALVVLGANVLVATAQDPEPDLPVPFSRLHKNKGVLKLGNVYKDCRQVTGAHKHAIKSFLYKKVPVKQVGKCFVKCVLDKYPKLGKTDQKRLQVFTEKTQFKTRYANLKCKRAKPSPRLEKTRSSTRKTTQATTTTEEYEIVDVEATGAPNNSLEDIFGEEKKGVVLPKINIRYDHDVEEEEEPAPPQPAKGAAAKSAKKPAPSVRQAEQHSPEQYESYENH